jgi:hypothetical protein
VSLRSASSKREKRALAAVSVAAACAMGARANTGALAGDRCSFQFSRSPLLRPKRLQPSTLRHLAGLP